MRLKLHNNKKIIMGKSKKVGYNLLKAVLERRLRQAPTIGKHQATNPIVVKMKYIELTTTHGNPKTKTITRYQQHNNYLTITSTHDVVVPRTERFRHSSSFYPSLHRLCSTNFIDSANSFFYASLWLLFFYPLYLLFDL